MKITRNVNGYALDLEFNLVSPDEVVLDEDNTRISFLMKQLPEEERNDPAAEHLLYAQEDTERLKKSIKETKGIQEPIYICYGKKGKVVKEGNRRTAAARELKRDNPGEKCFEYIPAWIIPEGTPDWVIQELMNGIHLNPKRQWAPFERALALKRLHESGEPAANLADRYEMTVKEVKESITAAELMIQELVPLVENPNSEVKDKYSYFLEYVKGPRQIFRTTICGLDERFANWVSNGAFRRGENVRQLGRILANSNALDALENEGFEAAIEVLSEENVNENAHYKAIQKAARLLAKMPHDELLDIRNNTDKKSIILDLARSVQHVMTLTGIPAV